LPRVKFKFGITIKIPGNLLFMQCHSILEIIFASVRGVFFYQV